MQGIRLASEEEIKGIAEISDLTRTSQVWAFPQDDGKVSLAVIRQCVEIDPIHHAEGVANSRKLLFAWGMENMLRVLGHGEYYFQVPVRDEPYLDILQKLGAKIMSREPEFRLKKEL